MKISPFLLNILNLMFIFVVTPIIIYFLFTILKYVLIDLKTYEDIYQYKIKSFFKAFIIFLKLFKIIIFISIIFIKIFLLINKSIKNKIDFNKLILIKLFSIKLEINKKV